LAQWLKATNKWTAVWNEILAFNSANLKKNESLSEIEWEGEPVTMVACPPDIKNDVLKNSARDLGIGLTVPPQSKNVLYSLIQHVKAKKEVEVDE